MKSDYSKRMRRVLRQLAGVAYERELERLLKKLEVSFDRRRRGELDAAALVAEVDDFAKGHARRRLSRMYESDAIVDMVVAQAIVRGVLTQDEVPAEVHVALERAITFYRQGLAERTVSFDEKTDRHRLSAAASQSSERGAA
jgi:hypothetical protein